MLGHRPAGEVPGGAVAAGGLVHVKGTRLVGVLGHTGAPLELKAGVVRVTASVPRHRRVPARLEVLTWRAAERGAADESVRHRRVGPGRPTVGGVGDATRRVTAAVVVVASDDIAGVQRVHRNIGLVLRLTTALQVAVGDVEAVLVDLDVAAQIHITRGRGHRGERASCRCGGSQAPPAEFQGQQAGHVCLLRRRELAVAERLCAHTGGGGELARSQQQGAGRQDRQRFRYTHGYLQAPLRGDARQRRVEQPRSRTPIRHTRRRAEYREMPDHHLPGSLPRCPREPRPGPSRNRRRGPSAVVLRSACASSRGSQFRHHTRGSWRQAIHR